MKKALSILFVVGGCLVALTQARAQGTVYMNNYDTGFGIYQGAGTTAAPAGTFVQILGGADAGSLTAFGPSSAPGNSIITIAAGDVNGNGPATGSFFDVGYGFVPGTTASGTGFFQVLVWSGAATYAEAAVTDGAWIGSTAVWSQILGTNPGGVSTPVPTVLALPGAIHLTQVSPVPEPSTFALAGLGLAGLLIFRRRK